MRQEASLCRGLSRGPVCGANLHICGRGAYEVRTISALFSLKILMRSKPLCAGMFLLGSGLRLMRMHACRDGLGAY